MILIIIIIIGITTVITIITTIKTSSSAQPPMEFFMAWMLDCIFRRNGLEGEGRPLKLLIQFDS